ncbi:MAG TPA: hypothetical protein VF556_08605 [Pyrinomonadaceae bacterium]|jgi:hypothetical protein
MAENRWKKFRISPELLLGIGTGKFEVVENSLPRDAEFVTASYDEFTKSICVVVSSETYPSIKNDYIPDCEPPIIQKIGE